VFSNTEPVKGKILIISARQHAKAPKATTTNENEAINVGYPYFNAGPNSENWPLNIAKTKIAIENHTLDNVMHMLLYFPIA
jgi:hypothetical protein